MVSTQGADTDDGLFELLFISHWHRQPGVGEDVPLVAPSLPERPDLAEQAQGAARTRDEKRHTAEAQAAARAEGTPQREVV